MPGTQDRRDTTQVHLERTLTIGASKYRITASNSPEQTGTLVVEVLGAGPHGEATTCDLTVSLTALPHLGPLLDQVLSGLAHAHGLTVDHTLAGSAPRRTRPVNAGQPWTDELKADLKQRWLAAAPTANVEALIRTIANEMGRTTDGIRSQLQRQRLDPDRPGSTYSTPSGPGEATAPGSTANTPSSQQDLR